MAHSDPINRFEFDAAQERWRREIALTKQQVMAEIAAERLGEALRHQHAVLVGGTLLVMLAVWLPLLCLAH